MARLTAEQIFDKYSRRIKGATQDMEIGVRNVTKSPMETAASKAEKWINSLQDSFAKGNWQRGLRSISLDDWKNAMITKGIGRVAAGVDGSKTKFITFMGQLLTYQDTVLAEIDKMPDNNIEDSIARQNHWTRRMAQFVMK
jgi:hypothetical protein